MEDGGERREEGGGEGGGKGKEGGKVRGVNAVRDTSASKNR